MRQKCSTTELINRNIPSTFKIAMKFIFSFSRHLDLVQPSASGHPTSSQKSSLVHCHRKQVSSWNFTRSHPNNAGFLISIHDFHRWYLVYTICSFVFIAECLFSVGGCLLSWMMSKWPHMRKNGSAQTHLHHSILVRGRLFLSFLFSASGMCLSSQSKKINMKLRRAPMIVKLMMVVLLLHSRVVHLVLGHHKEKSGRFTHALHLH